jgi:hypothetical protein
LDAGDLMRKNFQEKTVRQREEEVRKEQKLSQDVVSGRTLAK